MDIENLTEVELLEEYLITRLRTKEGIPVSDFRVRFGSEALMKLKRRCLPLIDEGLICRSETHISLSERAILISDRIISDLSYLLEENE